ncbi:MAG: phenylalanine--tRNA ligase subunit alpha, partial [Phycisphaerales bacterium]
MSAELDAYQGEAISELPQCGDPAALEAWRIAHLGTKGRLKGLMSLMKDASPAERPLLGQRLN